MLTLRRDGIPVFQITESGFLDSADIGGGTLQKTFALPPETYSTPGSYALDVNLSGVEDEDAPFSASGITTFTVTDSGADEGGGADSGYAGRSQSEIDESMQSIAQTDPQRAVAATISAVCPAGVAEARLQQDCNVLVGASFNDQAQASTALGQVTADQASTPVDASQTSVQSQIQNIGTRIAALRAGATGFSARGLTFNVDGQSLPAGQIAEELIHGLTGTMGGAAGDTALNFGPWGIFINGTVTSGDRDSTENVKGYDFDTWSVTLGADYRFRDNLVAGAALGYTKNDTDLDANGGTLDTDGFSLNLFGTYYHDSGLYLDGILTYGWNDYDQRRNIRYDIGSVSVDQSAKSDFDGSQWSASFGGGYSISHGAWSFGPTARLEYLETDVDGYAERMSNPNADGGGWATRIQGQDVTSFNSQLGGDISYAVSTNWGVLVPSVHLEWVHEFDDGAETVVGSFVEDTSGTPFFLPTDSPDTDYFNLRLGLSAQFAQGRSGFIYYRQLLGYEDLDAYTIGAGLRMEF
ncbi:MAG: autotransporter outer membrane beta-barrel domain-containing protein [Chromatiaceae bacterium]|nr:autotransporter outer membrane beta-barrel domain-containing protein [Chromatiaceae bacterium]